MTELVEIALGVRLDEEMARNVMKERTLRVFGIDLERRLGVLNALRMRLDLQN